MAKSVTTQGQSVRSEMMSNWHCMYSLEAAERCSSEDLADRVRALGQSENLSEEIRVYLENAYRRGFFQGFYQAIDMVSNEYDSDDLKYMYEIYYKWRYSKHNGKSQFPITYNLRDELLQKRKRTKR